jgi:hypothetical protein
MKTLDWSGVSNTSKISCYLANYGIPRRVFYILVKYLTEKIPWYSSIPQFYLKNLKILCSKIPPRLLLS